ARCTSNCSADPSEAAYTPGSRNTRPRKLGSVMLFWATISFTTGPGATAWAPACAGPASAAAATAEAKPATAQRPTPRPGLFMTPPPGMRAVTGRRPRHGAGTQSVDALQALAVVPERQPFPDQAKISGSP